MRTSSSTIFAGALVSMLHASHFVTASSPDTPYGEAYMHRRQMNPYGGLRVRGLDRRQAASSTTSSASSSTPTSLASWTAQVESDCLMSVTALNGAAGNPSGMAACYNVPYIDEKTGAFAAELRMYNVSAPTAEWTGVTTAQTMVSLAFLGATVQRTNSTPQVTPNIAPKFDVMQVSQMQMMGFAPSEIQVLSYVGKMNSNLLGPQMNMTQIEALLVPQIELMASNPAQNNKMVATVLSSSQADFTGGVFSAEGTTAISPEAQAQASAIANSLRPFVIPGVTLAFFPVGLVVTGVWMILFVGAIGAGTIGRYQFADQYRRQLKSQGIESQRRI